MEASIAASSRSRPTSADVLHFRLWIPEGAGPLRAPSASTAWLPSERLAKAWQSVVTDTPFH